MTNLSVLAFNESLQILVQMNVCLAVVTPV